MGETYEITGSYLLTWQEAVAIIAEVNGRKVTYKSITPKEFEGTLVAAGFPQEDTEFVATLVAEILDGKNSKTSDGLQRALGSEPRQVAQFVRAAQAKGCWD